MVKQCFKCGKVKNISEFYAHPAMGDGHLGKCKVCTCRDAREQREKNLLDPEWVKREAERCRKKMARYRSLGLYTKPSPGANKRWRAKNRDKQRAHCTAARAQQRGEAFLKTIGKWVEE